ncbi:MAG: hypothetical protein IPP90_09675 [Gemmatimonadaceae bacterium]|nr:hypothetical protein [Gemmatimonadaceae bacterium]
MRLLARLLSFAAAFVAVPLGAQLQTVESPTMRLIYTSSLQSYLVPQVTGTFENALRFHERLFNYVPRGRMGVLMHDLWHYGNAGARPVPENHVTIGIAPYGHEYESAPAPERMASSMNHELAHIFTTDKSTARDRFYRRLFFGKVSPDAQSPLSMGYAYLTTPRWYAPRWYLEGIATYLETWMNGGMGRAIGPYDEMVFRTLVRDSATIYDVVGLESEGTTVDFQVGTNSYLYGTRFISYLALRHGNDKLLAWVDRREGSRGYFSRQFRQVYGISLEEEWANWIAWEREWQQANLASIRKNPTTMARAITDRVLGSVSRAWFDETNGAILVAVRYPGQESHIASIDIATGHLTRLHDIPGASGLSVTSLVFDPGARTIFYTTNNADWRDLRAVDLRTGHDRLLIKGARIGDLAFNRADSSLWGVRHDNGFSTLVRLPAPYTEWRQVYTLPYGTDLFDLDISPDGAALIASMSAIGGEQKLVRFAIDALLRGEKTPDELYNFGEWSPSNFVFARDGRSVIGTSYFSGVSNVFRYDLERRVMRPQSNAETGFFKPLPISNNSTLVFAYSGRGFVPSIIPNAVPEKVSAIRFLGNEIAERRPEVQGWMPPPMRLLPPQSLVTTQAPYHGVRSLRLNSVYPIVEGYENANGALAVAGGLRFNFADQLGATGLDVSSSYSPDARLDAYERLHLRATFRHWNWHLSGALNRADFYDLIGPTRVSRRGASLAAQYSGQLKLDGPTSFGYTVQVAGHDGLSILPEFQGVATPITRLGSVTSTLEYKSMRRSLGATQDEFGLAWNAGIRGNAAGGSAFPRVGVDFTRGFLLPIDHSSVWFRAASGWSLATDRRNPLGRYYLGGFANNWIEHRGIKQFRDVESFAGLEINQVSGSSFAKGQIEWVSPPLRFRSAGIPSAYLRWAGLSVFASGLVTDVDAPATRRAYANAGMQVDLRFISLSHLESTLSAGVAVAGGRGVARRAAPMISLKLM